MWTTDKDYAGTAGNVHVKFDGDVCGTGWRNLKHPLHKGFNRGAEDSFKFIGYDIGSEVN